MTESSDGREIGSLPKASNSTERQGARKLTKSEVMDLAEKNKRRDRQRQVDEQARREPVIGVVRMAVTGLAVVTALSAGLWTLGTAGGHEDKVRSNAAHINELNEKLDQVSNESKNPPSPEAMRSSITRANERAKGLTDIQNRMIDYASHGDEKTIAAYAKATEDSRGYISRNSLSGGDFLPQGRWYLAHEPQKDKNGKVAWRPLGQDRWNWKNIPSTDIKSNGEVPVIWQSHFVSGKFKGQLLVTVKADYDPSTDQFHNFSRSYTPKAISLRGSTAAVEHGSSSQTGGEPENKGSEQEQKELDKAQKALDKQRKDRGDAAPGTEVKEK